MANPLTKMVGPYPLGVWLAVIGGGLGIAYFLQKGSDRAAAGAGTEASDGLTSTTAVPYFPPGSGIAYFDGAGNDDEPLALDNEGWTLIVTPAVVALGYTFTDVQTALINYINGEPTNCTIVNVANAIQRPPGIIPPVICSGAVSQYEGRVDAYGTPITGPHRKDVPGTPTGSGTGYAGNPLGKTESTSARVAAPTQQRAATRITPVPLAPVLPGTTRTRATDEVAR